MLARPAVARLTANVTSALCTPLHRACDEGDLARFASTRDRLAPLHQELFVEGNPIPLKAALGMLRLCAADIRTPLTGAPRVTHDRLVELLAQITSIDEVLAGLRLPALVH